MVTSALIPSDVNEATLRPIVRTMLDTAVADIETWQVSPITQGRASNAGVYRIAGTAGKNGQTIPWSLVLKELFASAQAVAMPSRGDDDPESQFYWKREVLLYQSGIFDTMPDGIRAPTCYHLDAESDKARIWMEDAREDVGTIWPLEHYGYVARHFGRLNGLYLGHKSLPTWLFTNFYTYWTERSEWPQFSKSYPTLRHRDPLVLRGWDAELVNGFQRIWQERHRFINALDQLPQTFHHNDSGRKNLIAQRGVNGDIVTVALDWGQSGIGAVGGELSCMLSQPVYWFHGVHPKQLKDLDEIVFHNYVEGLRDVGWQGDTRFVRLGYTASMALRGGFAIYIFEWAARDESTRHFIESAIGHPMEEIADVMRGFRRYVLDCAGEARQLMASPAFTNLGA